MAKQKVYLSRENLDRFGYKSFIASSKSTIPKNALKGESRKYFTVYKYGAHNYYLAKPGYKLVWE